MKTLKYINSNGDELTFTNSWPFLLKSFTQGTTVNNYSSKGSGQNGTLYVGNTLDKSNLTVELTVKGFDKAEYDRNKEKLRRLFNPALGEGYLIHNNGEKNIRIKCIPAKIPFLVDKSKRYGVGSIALTANNPLWEDVTETKEEIALWVGDFGFPLEILPEGIEMGHRMPLLIVNCINEGDVESGMVIEFRALATLTNPSLFNVNTREYIKINKGMVAGEIITIDTNYGSKRIISKLNGIETNIFNNIDVTSTFLQLYVQDNLFRYDADTGLDNLVVSIYHSDKYLGV